MNSMSAERNFNPSELSEDQVKIMAFTIAGVLTKHFQNERPMRAKEAMQFIGVGKTLFNKLVGEGKIKPHRISEDSNPFFFPSELIDSIKKH